MSARAPLEARSSAAPWLRPVAVSLRLDRYQRRFGGSGTIVTLDDGRAITAAHCLAKVDGTAGVVVGAGARRWRVVKRWSPNRLDLALLMAIAETRPRTGAGSSPPGLPPAASAMATRAHVRVGGDVAFVGHSGRAFQARAATVIAVTDTTATAEVTHRTGVCGNDSGGPVFMAGVLVGIVTHRMGTALTPQCSCQVVFTRLDSIAMRRRISLAR